MIRHILSMFLGFLFPEHCRCCGRGRSALCKSCIASLSCSKPIFEPRNAFALYDYEQTIIRHAIWELKYNRAAGLARALVLHCKPIVMRRFSFVRRSKVLVLVPIPQHYTKTLRRGFNQSLVIARWLERTIPSTRVAQLLQKTVRTTSQAKSHTKNERQQNLKHSVQVRRDAVIDQRTTYILIDDVITTGSTIKEASRALYAAGATSVYAIALAHGHASPQTEVRA